METEHAGTKVEIATDIKTKPNTVLKTRLILTAGVILAISLYVGFRNSSLSSMYSSYQAFLTVL